MKKRIIILAGIGLAVAGMAAQAGQDTLCNGAIGDSALVGEYTVVLGPGKLNGGGVTMAFAGFAPLEGSVFEIDGALALVARSASGGVLEMALTAAAADDRNYSFSDDPAFSALDGESYALLAGCDKAQDLPQYIGTGTLTGVAGVVLDSSMRLFVYEKGDEGISAVGRFDGAGMTPDGAVAFGLRVTLD